MAKFNGTLMTIYLLDSEPTNPAEITEYSELGNTKDLSISGVRAKIDLSDKSSGLDPDAVSGRREHNITATVNLNEGDEGQAIVDSVFASTRGEFWFLITQNLPGTTQYYGKAIITQKDLSFPEESPAQMNFGATVVGPLTTSTVPTEG